MMVEGSPAPPWAQKRALDEGAAPLMKRQAKAATPSTLQRPPSAAPIAKLPPTSKAPVAKVPSKAPIAKRPPMPEAGASFAKRPPPSPGQSEGFSKAPSPSGGPPASPSPESVARGASWQDFQDSDPLYALLGELGENKIGDGEEGIDEGRLVSYIERLVQPGIAKPKDWIEVWAAMNIPVTLPMHSLVVQLIIEHGVPSEVGETMGEVLAELVKGHRAKVKAVEDALLTSFEFGADEKDCISRFLLLIFPKSPTSEWGWSRVGWSWKEWWGLANKIFGCLEASAAFEALKSLLASLEMESGTYLPHQQIWDEKRLAIVRAALCKYGGLQEDELAAAVDISLS